MLKFHVTVSSELRCLLKEFHAAVQRSGVFLKPCWVLYFLVSLIFRYKDLCYFDLDTDARYWYIFNCRIRLNILFYA